MKSDIRNWCRLCISCQVNKTSKIRVLLIEYSHNQENSKSYAGTLWHFTSDEGKEIYSYRQKIIFGGGRGPW